MNNSFFLQQIQKRSNPDASLLSRQYKLNLMVDFKRMKYENPKLKQSQTSKSIKLLLLYFTKIRKRFKYAFTVQN